MLATYSAFPSYTLLSCYNDLFKTGGLNGPFKNDQKCLLDYMAIAQDNAKYIFRNLLFIALDLFSALEYFAKKGLVHRDVKRMEICKHIMHVHTSNCYWHRFKHPVNINM